MSDLPITVLNYLESIACSDLNAGFLQLNSNNKLVEWGGCIHQHIQKALNKHEPILVQLPVLEGLIPCTQTPVVVPYVQLLPDRYADIHLFSDGQSQWVVLLDTTKDGRRVQSEQQVSLSCDLESETNSKRHPKS